MDWDENFIIVDIEINAWSNLFVNLHIYKIFTLIIQESL